MIREGLKERASDGKWAAYEVGLEVSRQNGKGSCLEAVELAGMFLFGEQLIIHSAHEFKTAADAMRRLDLLLTQGGVKHKAVASHGQEKIEILEGPAKGARVMFIARTKVGGLGFSADRLILDEAMTISPESYQALLPTLISRPNPQVWLTGSAVDQRIHIGCEQFAGLRWRAMNSEPGKRLCYLEWSAPDDAPMDEREYWWMSNPGGGIRITEEDIEAEYESFIAAGGERAFGVQRLGIGDWPLLGAARSAIPQERWRNLGDAEPEFSGDSVLALYRAPEGGSWAIAAAQRNRGRVHLEVGYVGSDTADVVLDKFVGAAAALGPCAMIVGRGGAAELSPSLEAAGFEPEIPNTTDEAQACGGFLGDALSEGAPLLSHSGQTSVEIAITHAVKKAVSSGGFVWDRVNETSYAQLMAITLARWGLLKHGNAGTGPMIAEWPDDDEMDEWLAELEVS